MKKTTINALALGAAIGFAAMLASELELLRAFRLTSFDLNKSKVRAGQ